MQEGVHHFDANSLRNLTVIAYTPAMKNGATSTDIHFLRDELTKRLEKNPRYSMRAFANLLGINIGSLSGILNGKRALTLKSANDLCDRLGINPTEKVKILQKLSKKEKQKVKLVLKGELPDRIELEEEAFRAISDWYHYAILQIVRTERYLQNPRHMNAKWIARQLKISELETKLAIERLIKLNLLSDELGTLKRTEKRITTANKNLTSAALKKLQKQIREKAIYSIEHDSIELRSMTSLTMAINPKKMQEAKFLIDEFQEKLSDLLEEGEKEKVYQLEIGLFPIQITEN
jgi:uncharacterized protein (TIGR02147 family)